MDFKEILEQYVNGLMNFETFCSELRKRYGKKVLESTLQELGGCRSGKTRGAWWKND